MEQVTNVTPTALADVVAKFFLFGATSVTVERQDDGNYIVSAGG